MLEKGIYDKLNLRMMVEGMLYRLRSGCPWRDLPALFGSWNSVFQKFSRWSAKNIFHEIFKIFSAQPDLEWICIDGSIIRAHQHSSGAIKGKKRGIGRSCGGNTTKIYMAIDAFGLPLHFVLTAGHVHECKIAEQFIKMLPHSDYLIADKGYDSESLRILVRHKKTIPIIPRRSNNKRKNEKIDAHMYSYRHAVENVFARLKHFRSIIATRYDKLLQNYASMLALACIYLWLPM